MVGKGLLTVAQSAIALRRTVAVKEVFLGAACRLVVTAVYAGYEDLCDYEEVVDFRDPDTGLIVIRVEYVGPVSRAFHPAAHDGLHGLVLGEPLHPGPVHPH